MMSRPPRIRHARTAHCGDQGSGCLDHWPWWCVATLDGMPVPEFVVALRSKIGHAPLTLPGVTTVVLDHDNRVLLVRRSDTRQWALVTGCLEPGEQPAAGAVREIMEETGVAVVVERLLGVAALELSVAPNGDQIYWLDVAVQCRAVGGQARVNDDESVEVRWYDPDSMPALEPRHCDYLRRALTPGQAAWCAPP